jgi:hypothetical protein
MSAPAPRATRLYRAGAALAILTAFLTVWTTIVRDDGNGIGFLLLALTAMVGAFAAWFRPAGMARAMLGVAIMQALLALAIATAPSGAGVPDATVKALTASAGFTVLWLISAACFWAAARGDAGRDA